MTSEAMQQVILHPRDEEGNPVECGECGAIICELVIPAAMSLTEALERFDMACDACMAADDRPDTPGRE